MLAASGLALPAAPADADEDRKSGRIDHGEAACPGEALTRGVGDSQVRWSGLRIGLWRSPQEGELAGISATGRERLRDLAWDSFSHVVHDDLARTGSQAAASGDLLLGSAFRFTPGDAATPDEHGLAWRRSAPMGTARAHDTGGDRRMGLFAADCERERLLATTAPTERLSDWSDFGHATGDWMPTGGRGDESEGSLRHWRTAIGTWRVAPTLWNADGDTALSGPGAFGTPITSGAVPDTGPGNLTVAETSRVPPMPDSSRKFEAESGGILAPWREAGIRSVGGGVGASVELDVALGYGTY